MDEPPAEASDIVEEASEEATELRPVLCKWDSGCSCKLDIRLSMACWNILWIISGRCLANRASMCRMDSSGMLS
jgi:hypothetical protein